ncbi:Epidermal growth factor-like domain-containing protein [Strongyloides ratti]|uniref:Epidermal growth factor-like domain-containing protein n=1 Tax=Strongyloides ratti TaxID=34506 RepID=A0A090KWS9_STRRB|nr:Epidermal growth factor-like domain-containing protein [Strongyloides ratti]CEF61965.1 Epidermal growth factor-like domain-containing protein [Strongyloides ratti]
MKFYGNNLCDYNPCLNEGICQWPIVNESYFGCKCKPCYSGVFCERKDCSSEEVTVIYNNEFPKTKTLFHISSIIFLWILIIISIITTLRFVSRIIKLKKKEKEGNVIDCTLYVTQEDSYCSSLYDATHGETRKRIHTIKNALHREHYLKGFPPLKHETPK